MSKAEQKIKFDYIKSNYFRVLQVDGLNVDITPEGKIQIILWNERNSIPKRLVYTLSSDGELNEFVEEESDDRDSIVREIEVSFAVDIDTARGFAQLLKNVAQKIEELEQEEQDEPH